MTSTATLPTTAGRSIVEIDSLSKSFKDVTAVDDLSFSVEPGQVCGLLGPNGAGKTTTLRMLVGLIGPTSGSARLFGELVRPGAPELARVGALVEQAAFAPNLSGMANLRLWWQAGGGRMADADLDGALAVAGLGDAVHRKVKGYSQGMKQRLGFARLLLSRPELLILDEPTNGLDPGEIKEIRDLVRRIAETGSSVLLSSHHLAEVEQTCSHVVVMDRGRLVTAGTVESIISASGTVVIEVDDVDAATVALSAMPNVTGLTHDGHTLHVTVSSGPRSDLVRRLVEAGVAVETVGASRSLEDAFLGLLDGGSDR